MVEQQKSLVKARNYIFGETELKTDPFEAWHNLIISTVSLLFLS